MSNGERLPLLLFRKPVPAKKQPGSGRGPRFQRRSRQQVVDYLGPKLIRLEQALEAERVRIQASASGIEPEMALVLELATDPSNFVRAAAQIGLEWLAEDEIDLGPTEEIYTVDKKGRRRDKEFHGRLFLTMTNRRALDELLGRWRKWRDDPQAEWPRGETAWRDIFPLIVDIRPWCIEDRLRETGVLEDLAERLEVGMGTVPFEAELWFRQSPERRALAEAEVSNLVSTLGGNVRYRFQLPEIRYHTVLGEIPAEAAFRVLEQDHNLELLRCNDVWLFRPVGQCAAPLIPSLEGAETAAPAAELPNPELPPIVALLDGIPLSGHRLLEDRLVIDDPDGFEDDAPAQYRIHGTSMASLIVHGELDASEAPLRRRVYCRPIMTVQTGAGRHREHIPDHTLPVDLIHRAVRRLFEGEGTAEAQAPEVRLINLSVGDPTRPFMHSMSPWARLLDWLSDRYKVLFVVSAGNHAHDIGLDIATSDWAETDAESREAAFLRALKVDARNRRILSPAESINALSVGGAHQDNCPTGPVKPYHCDPFIVGSLASPMSANGLGFRRAAKPEILMAGGRQVFEEPPTTIGPQMQLKALCTYGPPGQKAAVPSQEAGELDKTLWFRGTSNAAALATRLGAQLAEILEALRGTPEGVRLSPRFDVVLLKALLVHGARWADAGERMRTLFKPEVGGNKIKEFIGRFLGYGQVDPERVLWCTDERATLLGFGTLTNGDAHAFEMPLPLDLSGTRGLRRVTITLAWLSPIAPNQQRYRKAQLWFTTDGGDKVGVGREDDSYDHTLVKRGTVQHEIFEGEEARAFADGEVLRIQVNCREDAAGMDDAVEYGLVVSFEVGENVPVPVYQQIRQRLRAAVPIAP